MSPFPSLMTSMAGQQFPFGMDHFNTMAQAKAQCREDFGVNEDDWEIVDSAPDLYAAVDQSIDDVVQKLTRKVDASESDEG